jgi:fructose-1,6-bisphosphatase I
MSLDKFLHGQPNTELSAIISAIASTSLSVWRQIPLSTAYLEGRNPSGDRQTKIDLFANDAFVSSLLGTGAVAEVASEELERPVAGTGHLHVAMDPLDGSSNVATNNPLGSIFGVYSSGLPCSGRKIVASVFVTYGPMLTLTLSLGDGVQRFTFLERNGKRTFELLEARIALPDRGEVFGLGGLRRDWIEPVEEFVSMLEQRGLKLRYGGTFVGDYNQILRYGGIFGYPALRTKPRGKLRILYELAPMAFITEKAGGSASDGGAPLLSIEPSELAETSPGYLGNTSLVEELVNLIGSG